MNTHYIYKACLPLVWLFVACLSFVGCKPSAVVPADAVAVNEQASVYPDYRDIVVPPNIAPLNILCRNAGDEFVACVEGSGQQVVAAAGKDEPLQFDSVEWKSLLSRSAGKDLAVQLYAKRDGAWVKFPSYSIHVASEPIDRYLSYRLIEPSYELYRQMGLYQRDLEGFDVQTIYENNRKFDEGNNHCVNCHNYQNYSTKNMLFHVRASHGGTVLIRDGKVEKRTIKSDSILAGATYPSWHPTRNWVVFSSNLTGQAFHVIDHQKIEVVDYGSDLFFYDVDKAEVRSILRTKADLETFPCWSPDGSRLFYTSAHVPEFADKPDSVCRDIVASICKTIRYNVMSIPFNPLTHTFGAPQLEVDCAAMGKSASVPRVSPDGRYVLYALGDYGQFHVWHTSGDLWVKDLTTGKAYPLTQANSPAAESYHTWSSNGRWIVFSSRRDDGSFTRPYIVYFDRNGQAHKAFLLPQLDPLQNIRLCKSYNVPELTRDAVDTRGIRDAILNDGK